MSSFVGLAQTLHREPWFGAIAFCDEKASLTMQFLQAVRELTRFQKEQLDALIAGDPDFGCFDALIAEAVERKNEAKYALMEHIESHGCAA
jgi:hypothetical protein